MHDAALRYFQAVAEEGSIRKASERVNVSASAVNRQILKLEDYFGTPLFERRSDGMQVTDDGRLVLDHIRATFHGLERLKGEISAHKGIVTGTVSIMTLDSLTAQFLPRALSSFISQHPAVQLRVISVDPAEPIRAVAQGSADLGLTFNFRSPVRKGVVAIAQIPSALKVLVTPDHELASRDSVTLEDCAPYPLLYQDDSGSVGVFLGREMEVFKRSHVPVMVSNALALMKQLLLDGSGIAFYTQLAFIEELASGRLVAIPIENEVLSSLELSLIRSSERLPTVAVRTMAEHLKMELTRFSDEREWPREPNRM